MYPSSTPLKTSENLPVFCFQGVEEGCFGNKWVNALRESSNCDKTFDFDRLEKLFAIKQHIDLVLL